MASSVWPVPARPPGSRPVVPAASPPTKEGLQRQRRRRIDRRTSPARQRLQHASREERVREQSSALSSQHRPRPRTTPPPQQQRRNLASSTKAEDVDESTSARASVYASQRASMAHGRPSPTRELTDSRSRFAPAAGHSPLGVSDSGDFVRRTRHTSSQSEKEATERRAGAPIDRTKRVSSSVQINLISCVLGE